MNNDFCSLFSMNKNEIAKYTVSKTTTTHESLMNEVDIKKCGIKATIAETKKILIVGNNTSLKNADGLIPTSFLDIIVRASKDIHSMTINAIMAVYIGNPI